MSKESLKFKVGLSGTFHNKRPAYSICIDNVEYTSGTVTVESKEIFYCEFVAELGASEHCLQIKLLNKESSDTLKDHDQIVKDMLLNIESIEIDEIDLGSMLWAKSQYLLDSPQHYHGKIIRSLDNCVNLGWNGTYQFKFTSPFFVWLLENM